MKNYTKNNRFIVLEKIENTSDDALEAISKIMIEHPSWSNVSVTDYKILLCEIDGTPKFKVIVTLENKLVKYKNSYVRRK